jgi:beta-lactamase superfamily II metal-dependent hydrolase
MDRTRRGFLRDCSAVGALGAFGFGCSSLQARDEVYPGWKPGEMDLHFIYTGSGENMFYRLPDGTSIVNDVGDFFRPKDLIHTPLLPSPDRVGGEWVSRYIKRVYDEKEIDYLIFSHYHADHIGFGIFDTPETPEGSRRFKVLPDGTKINGFRCVAEDFTFRRYIDHQFPGRNVYKTADGSLRLLAPWLDEQKKKGLECVPFKVGALDQIALLRDPDRYKGEFSIRNVCANGCLWDGKSGYTDYAAAQVAKTGNQRVAQNPLSLGFVVKYGNFRYWAGGDVHLTFNTAQGVVDYEAEVGRRVGKVTVCKTNHHACDDAMNAGFIDAVRAQAYITCVWSHWHIRHSTMTRMASKKFHPDFSPDIIPNCMPKMRAEKYRGEEFMKNVPPETLGGVHVVVKVLPGGNDYRIYLLDARDESMRVLRRLDRQVVARA